MCICVLTLYVILESLVRTDRLVEFLVVGGTKGIIGTTTTVVLVESIDGHYLVLVYRTVIVSTGSMFPSIALSQAAVKDKEWEWEL